MATIVQVEFPPVFAEEPVNVNGSQLTSRCKNWPHTEAIVMGPEDDPETEQDLEEGTLYLDNDGNAFAVVIGNSSCASGSSLIEASLENAPYTTYTANFTVEPPQPTFPDSGSGGWASSDAMTDGPGGNRSRAFPASRPTLGASRPAGGRALAFSHPRTAAGPPDLHNGPKGKTEPSINPARGAVRIRGACFLGSETVPVRRGDNWRKSWKDATSWRVSRF